MPAAQHVGTRAVGATPLYQLKAEFFKALGHPARIRVLELLAERGRSVGELAAEVGLEAAHLSQQLGVLRRVGVVVTEKQGNSVIYSLAAPEVADLLAVARHVLTEVLSGQVEMWRDLQTTARARQRPRR